MAESLIARADVDVQASPSAVWAALTDPQAIAQYMFGTAARSTWTEGSPVTWSGTWQGRSYEDKGVVLTAQPGRRLRFTHFSPLAGLPDVPENYHTVTIDLSGDGTGTHVTLVQDKNETEEARAHSQQNWVMVLEGLKKYVEAQG